MATSTLRAEFLFKEKNLMFQTHFWLKIAIRVIAIILEERRKITAYHSWHIFHIPFFTNLFSYYFLRSKMASNTFQGKFV